jgi:hypothetical protein
MRVAIGPHYILPEMLACAKVWVESSRCSMCCCTNVPRLLCLHPGLLAAVVGVAVQAAADMPTR